MELLARSLGRRVCGVKSKAIRTKILAGSATEPTTEHAIAIADFVPKYL